MAFTKLTTDVEHVQALNDRPNANSGLTADQVKAAFDQAGTDIKTYINNTLTPELDSNSGLNLGVFNVMSYGALGDGTTDDTVAIQEAMDSAGEFGIVILPSKSIFKVSSLSILIDNLTIFGYNSKIICTDIVNAAFEIKGSRNKIFGVRFIPANELAPLQSTAIHINNDGGQNATDNVIRDCTFYNIYRGVDNDMDGSLTTASYRNKIESCIFQNQYLPKAWSGSFGVRFTGNTSGNAAGNDSKIINSKFHQGYEKNIILKNSVAPKIIDCSIDGALVGIENDNSSTVTVIQSYLEYNTTVISALNAPYRMMMNACTYANYTTFVSGSFSSGEQLLDNNPQSPPLMRDVRTFNSVNYQVTRILNGNGSGFRADVDSTVYDFLKIGTKHGLVPSITIDLHHHIASGFKHYFGDIAGSEFTTIDDRGFIQYKQLTPAGGNHSFTASDTSPAVDASTLHTTANVSATSITRFDSGIVGLQFCLLFGDSVTTLVQSSVLKLKGGANKTPTAGEMLQFVCTAAPTPNTSTFYEV